MQSVGPYRLVRLTAPHKNPIHGAIICMVGHIVESDSDVQCYLQKVSCGSVGLPRQWSQYVICQGIQLVVVHIRITHLLLRRMYGVNIRTCHTSNVSAVATLCARP
jgi:hypothetical protein